jgi:predicted metal-dependent hydrolase
MATKKIVLAGVGAVTLIKRSGNRSIRLTVSPSGVRVSMPKWTPFSAGQTFAQQHTSWIQQQIAQQSGPSLESGQRIGKMHYLRFEQVLGNQSVSSRVTGTEIIIKMHNGETIGSETVQKRAQSASIRALKREAERLLPPRLASLATKHDKHYKSVIIKQLKRRWGSCDSHQNIAFNLFLMELPWEYIDYVLLHELAHTVEMNHGDEFWKVLTSMDHRAKDLARQLRVHQPTIGTWA